ncbi:DUF1266 domain-containing protein [Cohnella terricola]|nr:DUF1266 domain-containing protein [Cohnella terricola]
MFDALRKKSYINAMTSVSYIGEPIYDLELRRSSDLRTCSKSMLREWMNSRWGIKDQFSLNKKLEWLFYKGHRMEFTQLSYLLSTLSHDKRNQFIYNLPEHDPRKIKLYHVNQFMGTLTSAGIAAFDYSLYMLLSQIGVRLNYRKRDEAKAFYLEVAQIAQSKYQSWIEFIQSYIAGMYFHSLPQESDIVRDRSYTLAQLITQKNSAINSVEWNIKLRNAEG